MFARTTMAELDPVRMSVDDAVRVFKESVIPAEGIASGFYDDQLAKFVTIYRSERGREIDELVLAEAPALTIG